MGLNASGADVVTTTFGYDAFGARVYQIASTTATTTYPFKWFSIASTTKGSTNYATSTEYIFNGDTLLSTVEQPFKNGAATGTAAVRYVHPDHLGSTNVVTDQNQNVTQTLDYYPYGATRISNSTSTNEKRKFIGQFMDDTNLEYLNARYYSPSQGQFISQDPVFWEIGLTRDGVNAMSDPQALNSYGYASDNPITNKDPNGRWYKEFITGQQSWPSFQLELGDAANQLAQNSSAWGFAFDHPYMTGAGVGVGSGLAAYGASAGLTAVSVDSLAGIGTRNMGNLTRLDTLPQTTKVPGKLEILSKQTGKSIEQILKEASQNGKPYIDFRNGGNINILNPGATQNTLTRITTNPQITKIISAGTMQLRSLSSNLSSGGMQSLQSTLSGLTTVLTGILNTLKGLR
jgi:RHS repeat-associated protein